MLVLRLIPLLVLTLGMFYYPQEVLVSASKGLTLWWQFVVPALLPFFILSELLMGEGFVHFLGVIFEPLMRPLFRLPGSASFVVAMTHTSGIPIGAVLTTRLRQQGDVSREEGERLLAFTSNPSPGFMLGAVSSGMLGRPELGFIIAGSVYLANFMVGLLFRFYRVKQRPIKSGHKVSFKRALAEMSKAQKQDGRPFGQILGDSIRQSVTTILLVGGFITFFSVIIHLLEVFHITSFLASLLSHVLGSIIPHQGIKALIEGILEVTIGCQNTINAFTSLNQQIGFIAFILGWGGISAFAQVASIISATDLRFSAFLIGRTLHGLFAFCISQIFLSFLKLPATSVNPALPLNLSEFWAYSWRSGVAMLIIIIVIFGSLTLGQKIYKQFQT